MGSEDESSSSKAAALSQNLWQHYQQLESKQMQDLRQERLNVNFDIKRMTYYLDGGIEMTKAIEGYVRDFERDATFKIDDLADLSKDQIRERVISRAPNLSHRTKTDSIDEFRLRMRVLSLVDPGFLTRMGVHYGLFLGTISGSGTKEQLAYWIEKGVLTLNGVTGCFGMTEMGHGSNVAGIETIATFDEENDEFIINTPTLTATKWWIGGAAQTCTHCCVFARLIVKGKDYGVKSFVVQLRSPETFDLMPGVAIGDMGMKYGRNAIDNGWIQFTNVRIPRVNMLMKHTKVTPEGKVKESPFQQLAYGALIHGRMAMVGESCDALKKALTIAIRYSAVRRQFKNGGPSGEENKILDYQTHQARLFPLLAITFALSATVHSLRRIQEESSAIMERSKPSDSSMKLAIDSLKELHGTVAGLKAYSTWIALEGIETCRQCCGGNGYSAYSAFPGMIQDFSVQCTWEGDNTVLMLQSGRYLISCYREWKAGKSKLPQGVDYLNRLPSVLIGKSNGNLSCPQDLKLAFDVVRANLVKTAYEEWQSAKDQGKSEEMAYEACALSRSEAAKFHCFGMLFEKIIASIESESSLPGNAAVLKNLALLYALWTIKQNAGAFLMYAYYTPAQMKRIGELVIELYAKIRPLAVPLVDSFNLNDYLINTPIGSYDGDVYKGLFQKINRQNPQGEHPYKHKIIALLNRNREKEKVNVEGIELVL
jgi:acyl-CoA oxidase